MLLKKNKAEFLNCNLAGFGHTEGYLVLDEMRPGDKLLMVREDENKHDNDAIALFYVPKHKLPEDVQTHFIYSDGKKCLIIEVDVEAYLAAPSKQRKTKKEQVVEALHVGYIPANSNHQLSTMLDMGYAAVYECVITYIDKEAHPNQQVQIRVNVLENK
ncbi:MAG: hypothetical protein IJ776_05495 [Paludibacteraceae bacterium]|nr:hypothetical protein [Paludibacteraceae bacterium]